MRVLVTGATGFVGRHAVLALIERGHEVVAVARRPGLPVSGIEWIAADLLRIEDCKRVGREARADALLHLAWTVEHGKYWTDPANLDWVAASLCLVKAAAEAGTRRVCAAGTCFEYDWPIKVNCIERVTALCPHTLYDTAKDACRRALESYAAEIGLSFAWARLFYLYGPGENPARLVSSIARALLAGKPANISRGLAVRDYMDVRDAGKALALLATSEVDGPVNIASGEAASVADIADTLGRLALRPELIQIGALPDRPDDPPRIAADVTRLRQEVGAGPSRSLQQGLADALDFWQEDGKS